MGECGVVMVNETIISRNDKEEQHSFDGTATGVRARHPLDFLHPPLARAALAFHSPHPTRKILRATLGR